MIKLGISMGSATLVAMLILIGGSLSDVRIWAVLTRCITGFFAVGSVVYLTTFVLEAKGIVGFDRMIDDDDEDDDDFNNGQGTNFSVNKNQGGVEDNSSDLKFTPLSSTVENLRSK